MAERANPFSPGFSSRCAVSPVIAGEGVFMLHSFLLGVIKKTLSAALVNLVSGAVNKLIALIGKILWKLSAPIRFLWRKMKVLAGRCARRAAREARIRRRQIKYRLTAWEKVIKMRLCKRREKRQSKRQNKEQAAKKLSGKKLRRGEAES